ncbi:MAG: DUF4249 family protein, partial [Bacteroidales bacterium]
PSVGEGVYKSSLLAKQGKRYTLEVKIKDFDKQVFKITPPRKEKILNIVHINEAGVETDNGVTCPAFKITFTTNPNKKEYFQIRASYWHDYYSYWRNHEKQDDEESGFHIESYPVYIINISDPILLNEGLPILVFSNEQIKESVYTMYIEYSGSGNNRDFKMVNGVSKQVLCPLSIELLSIDSAYYQYLKSAYLYDRGRFDGGIGQVYQPYQLFSNIPGGYGLVASYSLDKYDTIFPAGK